MEEKIWKADNNQWNGAINMLTNSRYDENGIDKHGFNKEGIHVITKGEFDENGYDRFGFNKNFVNKYGIKLRHTFPMAFSFVVDGKAVSNYRTTHGNLEFPMNMIATDESIFEFCSGRFLILKLRQSERIFDENGIDQNNFTREGINIITNKAIDNDGYNALGYNMAGYDREGYDIYGLDKQGYDEYGYNLSGRDKDGYDREGYDKNGYDKDNLDRSGRKRPEKQLSEEEEKKREENKIQTRKNYLGLINKTKKLGKGELSLEDYVKTSKTSIDDLIDFAKKEKMSADVIRGLYKYKKPYALYKKPFAKKQYLESTTLLIDGQEVRPTEGDVDKCIAYLKANNALISDKTVRDTVRKYLKGEVDITIKTEELQEQIEENKAIIAENEEKISQSLVEVVTCQQKKIKSQESEITDLKSQRRGIDEQ